MPDTAQRCSDCMVELARAGRPPVSENEGRILSQPGARARATAQPQLINIKQMQAEESSANLLVPYLGDPLSIGSVLSNAKLRNSCLKIPTRVLGLLRAAIDDAVSTSQGLSKASTMT